MWTRKKYVHMLGISTDTKPPQEELDGGQTGGVENGTATGAEEPHRSKVDVYLETGLTPERFIIKKIDANGGSLKQQAIIDITGWSSGAISNLLVEMEDAESIERVWIGREKMVYLPGTKPNQVAPPEIDEAGSR